VRGTRLRAGTGGHRNGLFWAKVLIAPNVTEAATVSGIDPGQVALAAPNEMPSFGDKYLRRRMGVLDTWAKQ
jgi:hypothetical protein